jgi:23S rRNA (cytosine1962-C5)-methyltransferase
MKLQFKQSNDLIFIDKPSGFSTHSPDLGKTGICEIFEKELQTKLYIVHRLDKTTTGCLAFAKTPEAAAQLTELFQTRQVQKKYLFVTTGVSSQSEFECDVAIEGKPAHTCFRRIKRTPFYESWEAIPTTGRAHQIRIHASQSGLPILGDTFYGGDAFPHLCLHALELQIPGHPLFQSPLPVFMERLGLLRDSVLVQWLSELDRRQRLYGFIQNPEESLRLIHLEDLRLDLYGSQLWFYWYKNQIPTRQDLERCIFVAGLIKKGWLLRKMQNRGEDPHERKVWQSSDWQSDWQAQENGLRFQFHSELGQSPGLFLDQRENRKLLKNLSAGKRVLNLFSYTCGFSVNAASGGASEVVSVDLSRPFLDWGQQNLNLNLKDPSQYEFYQQESIVFLRGTLKRGRQFDLIICDPPSFGRHKKGVFRLDQELPDLLKLCWDCLAPQGKLLFSSNLEKWDLDEFRERIQKVLKKARIESGRQGWDFEIPNEEPLMKSFWISKI